MMANGADGAKKAKRKKDLMDGEFTTQRPEENIILEMQRMVLDMSFSTNNKLY